MILVTGTNGTGKRSLVARLKNTVRDGLVYPYSPIDKIAKAILKGDTPYLYYGVIGDLPSVHHVLLTARPEVIEQRLGYGFTRESYAYKEALEMYAGFHRQARFHTVDTSDMTRKDVFMQVMRMVS